DTPMDWSGSLELGVRSNLLHELAEHDAQKSRLAQERGKLIVDAGVQHLAAAGVSQAKARLLRGDIVEVLKDIEADADLIVLGKRGEAADFARMHLGSNLERVARVSSKPVMVASRAFKPVNAFMIAYDGGASADKAVDHIAKGKLFPGTPCHLVIAGSDTEQARSRLENANRKLTAAGFETHASLIPGDAEKVIAEYVKANDIGLLVMGAYGHSRIRNFIIGSTTTEMIRSVLIPVMLFR
uniref:universal stress protein n=1 Tax=Pelagibacterium montanilacus TaxID=2185280 RepID=UPI0013E0A2CE